MKTVIKDIICGIVVKEFPVTFSEKDLEGVKFGWCRFCGLNPNNFEIIAL